MVFSNRAKSLEVLISTCLCRILVFIPFSKKIYKEYVVIFYCLGHYMGWLESQGQCGLELQDNSPGFAFLVLGL